jgi:ribokinase
MKPNIVVIGSTNMDMIVRTNHIPQKGETVLGGSFIQSRGGKGANQAVAAARLGADVTFVTCLGKDQFGQDACEAYEKEGINTKYIAWDEEMPTGVALIMIDSSNENIICVAPGANEKLTSGDITKAEEAIKSADCVLLQLEIPMKTVEFAVKMASKYHVPVVLNPAPMANLSENLLELIGVITPNETEASDLLKNHESNPHDLAIKLLQIFKFKSVVVTMGKEGAVISSDKTPTPKVIPGFQMESVDSTGAGDAFNGGLVVALARGEKLEDAVRYANAVGALATTRVGAQSSLPTDTEVATFLREQSIR